MHLRRRGKRPRRQGEKFLDAGVELRGGRKQSIVAGAGLGRDAVRNLALYQDYDGLKIFRVVEQAQQNFGSDVVGKVADDLAWLGLELDAGTAQPRLGAEQGIEVDRENVSLDDFDTGEHAETQAKLRSEYAVKFNRDEPSGALGQQRGE